MRRSIQMRAKRDSLLGDLPQLIQTEDLKSPRIGQNGPRPAHEAMQSSQLPNLINPRPKIEVISVPEENLNVQFFEQILGHALYGCQRPYGHEYRRFNHTMRSDQ